MLNFNLFYNKFFRIFLLLLFFHVSIISFCTESKNAVEPIINMLNYEQLPRNFRMTFDPIECSTDIYPFVNGLCELKASGSAQFSEASLEKLKETIPSNHVIIVDLRQESHGFVDGMAMSWKGQHNWANIGKKLEEIQEDEQQRLKQVKEQKTLLLYKGYEKLLIPVIQASTEEQIVKSKGLHYLRIPVTDHRRPTDAVVDEFIELVKNLPQDAWLHFHCAAGKGRTTTFLAMYDMIHNAKQVSYADILRRQMLIGGIDLMNVATTVDWKVHYIKARVEFIKQFYHYCQEGIDQESWSSWLTKQKLQSF